jgi:hypothetical protein
MGGANGSTVLLRATGAIHNLCLECHGDNGDFANTDFTTGSQTYKPPKVYFDAGGGDGVAASNVNPFNFSDIGAGGDFGAVFNWDGATSAPLYTGDDATNYSLGYGHSLGAAAVVPPGADEAAITAFSCTNCHAAHFTGGIAQYRLLRGSPIGGGGAAAADTDGPIGVTAVGYVGASGDQFYGRGETTTSHIWPVVDETFVSANYYPAGVDGADEEMAGWCALCHDNWHEDVETTNISSNGLDWLRHPVNNPITDATPQSGNAATITDWTHYNTALSTLLTQPLRMRLPAANAAGGTTYYADNSADRVFCLSCHYAHAGPNYDNLRWTHQVGGSVAAGNQTGTFIASNVGCQQCHNR